MKSYDGKKHESVDAPFYVLNLWQETDSSGFFAWIMTIRIGFQALGLIDLCLVSWIFYSFEAVTKLPSSGVNLE